MSKKFKHRLIENTNELEFRTAELQIPIEVSYISGRVQLPKGTIITDSVGGIFAQHDKLSKRYSNVYTYNPKYGLLITRNAANIFKINRSVNFGKEEGKKYDFVNKKLKPLRCQLVFGDFIFPGMQSFLVTGENQSAPGHIVSYDNPALFLITDCIIEPKVEPFDDFNELSLDCTIKIDKESTLEYTMENRDTFLKDGIQEDDLFDNVENFMENAWLDSVNFNDNVNEDDSFFTTNNNFTSQFFPSEYYSNIVNKSLRLVGLREIYPWDNSYYYLKKLIK